MVGDEVTKAILEFFRKGNLLKQFNATMNTLIPKKEGADRISDFRPISLCNVFYKVISKLIARRLQDILPLMISNLHFTFVKGRLLVKNVLLASELIRGFNQKGISRRGLLKVDLRKAFDTVKWEFILTILKAADLPETFINWISQCLTTTSLSIMVNDNICGNFKGSRGLRQGDPLFSALFVIAMEIVGNLLNSKVDAVLVGLTQREGIQNITFGICGRCYDFLRWEERLIASHLKDIG